MTEQTALSDGKSENLLEIRNLWVEFQTLKGSVKAVNGLNLAIKSGDAVALVGETGCGKSVTALSILRLLPTVGLRVTGEVLYAGKNLFDLEENAMRKVRGKEIAMIFQEPASALNPVFSVKAQVTDLIRLHLRLNKEEALERTIQLLGMVGIKNPKDVANRYPHELSGGMKQRVMIAMALTLNPSVLLADEPTTALDVTTQARILEVMHQLVQKLGLTLVLITHDIGIASAMCSKLAVMYVGEIVEYGNLWEILEKPAHPYTQALIRAIPSLERKDALISIEGTVPNAMALPSGCKFHPRCPYAMPKCSTQIPAAVEVSEGHIVSCHLYGTGEGR